MKQLFWCQKNLYNPRSYIGAMFAKYEKHIDFNEKLWYNKS